MSQPRRAAVVAVAAVVLAGVASGSAEAARPWPGRAISYYNGARVWGWSVRQAVAAWNAAGLRIRFVPAGSRAGAQVVISTRRLPRLRGGVVAGRATVGYARGRRGEVQLAPPGGPIDRFAMARIAAHELGHVLGLGHARASCALMVDAVSARRWGECPPSRASQWRCRLIERHDQRRALRLYGGHGRPLREPPVCFRHGPPGVPSDPAAELTAAEAAAGWTIRGRLRWRNPDSASFAGVRVTYAVGACPTGPRDDAARTLLADADDSFLGARTWARRRGAISTASVSLDGLTPGSYCFAVWSTDEAALRHSAAPATVQLDVGPPPAQPPAA